MGHEVGAAVLATVLVGALRNARRAGAGLAEQAGLANAGLCAFAQRGGFVTGQVARIDLGSATAAIVNAGHPPPLRLRDGSVECVPLRADPPFGIVPGHEYHVQRPPLRPGDRLMFFTDGMLERNAATVDVEALVAATAELHPREAVQHVLQAVLVAADGMLKDDAAAMCLDWHGGPPRERTSDSGAND
jgi:serine phosphatase RsbU (regulator of sigma subunit)